MPPEHIVAITFTRAAAAEMENRLFAELTKWAADDDAAIRRRMKELVGHAPGDLQASAEVARRLLVQVLECPGGIRIQTIHAFCQSLLASFPLEAGLAPHFRALDEIEAGALRTEARTSMLQAAGQQGGALAEAFRTVARTLAERQIGEVLNDFSSRRRPFHEIVNRSGGIDAYVARIAARLNIDPTDTEAGVIRRAWLRTEPGNAGSAARQALDVLAGEADTKTSAGQSSGCPRGVDRRAGQRRRPTRLLEQLARCVRYPERNAPPAPSMDVPRQPGHGQVSGGRMRRGAGGH